MRIKKHLNNKGAVLVSVIIFVVVLVLLVGSAALIMSVETTQSQASYDEMQAYYLAKAGADSVAEFISDFSVSSDNPVPEERAAEITAKLAAREAKIDSIKNKAGVENRLKPTDRDYFIVTVATTEDGSGNTETITITSKSTVNTNSHATVELEMDRYQLNIGELTSTGYFGKKFKATEGKVLIDGDITRIDEDGEYDPNEDSVKDSIVSGHTTSNDYLRDFKLPPFPIYPSFSNMESGTGPKAFTNTGILTDGTYYKNGLSLTDNANYNVGGVHGKCNEIEITSSTDITIRTKSLVTNGGKITMSGGGKLTIYIDGGTDVKLDGFNIEGNVEIYYNGTSTNQFFLGNSSHVNAEMYIMSRSVNIEGNSDFTGNLIFDGTGDGTVPTQEGIFMQNNTDINGLIYAPNDEVYIGGSDDTPSGNVTVNGVVVADSIEVNHPANLNKGEVDNGSILEPLQDCYSKLRYK